MQHQYTPKTSLLKHLLYWVFTHNFPHIYHFHKHTNASNFNQHFNEWTKRPITQILPLKAHILSPLQVYQLSTPTAFSTVPFSAIHPPLTPTRRQNTCTSSTSNISCLTLHSFPYLTTFSITVEVATAMYLSLFLIPGYLLPVGHQYSQQLVSTLIALSFDVKVHCNVTIFPLTLLAVSTRLGGAHQLSTACTMGLAVEEPCRPRNLSSVAFACTEGPACVWHSVSVIWWQSYLHLMLWGHQPLREL